jgi:pimeloyl-ACP methyl ester carboxylesterase
MASIRRELEYRLAAAAAINEPEPLLEWQRALHSPGPATMRIGFRTVDRVRIRYAESEGPAERTIVLTSPWPESLYAFVPMWAALAHRFRLFAVDLPGFGGSEHRADLLSPERMGSFLIELIDACELGRPHIVAPDVGTSAALFAAAASPASISSLIVGCGATAAPIDLGEPLRSWVMDSDLDHYRSIDSGAIVDAALGTVERHVFPKMIREDYLASYAGERFVESMRYVRRYPDALPVLAQRLAGIETPVLVFAGNRDRVVPVANADFLIARLPRSRLVIFDAGHFLWEESADEWAAMIANWVTDGWRERANA